LYSTFAKIPAAIGIDPTSPVVLRGIHLVKDVDTAVALGLFVYVQNRGGEITTATAARYFWLAQLPRDAGGSFA